jgi:hypothetical protein
MNGFPAYADVASSDASAEVHRLISHNRHLTAAAAAAAAAMLTLLTVILTVSEATGMPEHNTIKACIIFNHWYYEGVKHSGTKQRVLTSLGQ